MSHYVLDMYVVGEKRNNVTGIVKCVSVRLFVTCTI